MALRLYFVAVVGSGTTADPFRPAGSAGTQRDGCDCRADGTVGGGEFALVLDTDATQHATMLGVAGVTYAPFENASGVPRLPGDPLSSVSAANRATLKTMLEARSVPIDDFVGTDLCRQVWRRVVVRMLIRQILGANDITEGLDTLVSAMTAQRRQTLAQILQAAGYDTTGMGQGTVRQALALLANQVIRMTRTGVAA